VLRHRLRNGDDAHDGGSMGIDENVVDINHFKQQDEKYTAQLNISVQALLKMEEEPDHASCKSGGPWCMERVE
jgi:hypothetical protein